MRLGSGRAGRQSHGRAFTQRTHGAGYHLRVFVQAIDGGHLPGNKDQLHAGSRTHGHASPVPGAKGKEVPSEDAGFTPQDPQPKATGGVPPVQELEPAEVQDNF